MNYLIPITMLTFIGLALVIYSPSSKSYYENVGPSWDRMLNPNKYKEPTNEGN